MKNKHIILLIKIFLIIFIFIFFTIFFINNLKNISNHIITEQLPRMKQYHSMHNSIQINKNEILILGNGISYGVSELYLLNKKKFKIYSKESFGNYILYSDNDNVFYYDKNKIICYNPKTGFSIKYEIKLDSNIIHPKICLTHNNKLLVYGGSDNNHHQSKNWLIYDSNKKTILDKGKWKINITNNSEILELMPNLFIIYSDNSLFQTYYGNFNKIIKISDNVLYNLKFYPGIEVNNSFLISYYETKNENIIKFALLNKKTLELSEIKIAQLNPDFKPIILQNNKLLLVGTSTTPSDNRGIYLFTPSSHKLQFLGNMRFSRKFHSAILADDRETILITGGSYDSNELNGQKTAEIIKVKDQLYD